MKVWAVVNYRAPLECIELPDPVPQGTEVLLQVSHCGVCHSDLHLWHGGYDLGGGKFLTIKERGLTLPAAPGHEIVGRVLGLGPDASGVRIGDERLIYPWIGCGRCEMCAAGQDNLCSVQRSLGVNVNGGFGGLVKVTHPRYLIDFSGINAALAATYACSGLTAYSAVKKVLPLASDQPVVLIGAGGLGLAAIAMLKALGHQNIVSVELAQEKRDAALAAGASQVIDGSVVNTSERIVAEIGKPVLAVLDFVGSDTTAATGLGLLAKAGKLVLVGIGGGLLSLSVSLTIFRSNAILGSLTGSVQELREVIALAQAGKLEPTPIQEVRKHYVNEVMQRLENGQVTGRVVLVDP